MLLQKQPDATTKTAGHWSRSLTTGEQAYDTTQRKCLAIIWSVLMLRLYRKGTHFMIKTNNDSLKWILSLAFATGRFTWWRLCLSKFKFDVVHRTGIENHAADTLSCL